MACSKDVLWFIWIKKMVYGCLDSLKTVYDRFYGLFVASFMG